jgi:hypothetical protein
MNVHILIGQMDPLPSVMKIKAGEGGHLSRLENSFNSANFKQDLMCYINWFVTDVVGSRQVTTLVKNKAHGKTPHIEHKKEYHE